MSGKYSVWLLISMLLFAGCAPARAGQAEEVPVFTEESGQETEPPAGEPPTKPAESTQPPTSAEDDPLSQLHDNYRQTSGGGPSVQCSAILENGNVNFDLNAPLPNVFVSYDGDTSNLLHICILGLPLDYEGVGGVIPKILLDLTRPSGEFFWGARFAYVSDGDGNYLVDDDTGETFGYYEGQTSDGSPILHIELPWMPTLEPGPWGMYIATREGDYQWTINIFYDRPTITVNPDIADEIIMNGRTGCRSFSVFDLITIWGTGFGTSGTAPLAVYHMTPVSLGTEYNLVYADMISFDRIGFEYTMNASEFAQGGTYYVWVVLDTSVEEIPPRSLDLIGPYDCFEVH